MQDHGAGGRLIGSLTTIHTNIPAMSKTSLALILRSIIMILYLNGCSTLTGYVTKLFVIHLEQKVPHSIIPC